MNFNKINDISVSSVINLVETRLVRKPVNTEKGQMVKEAVLNKREIIIELLDKVFDIHNLCNEHMILICLNCRLQITSINTVSIGTNTETMCSAANILKVALLENATSIILVHNHPSGSVEPSQADINATLKVHECSKLMNIELLDHMIIGDKPDKYYSMSREGIII